MAKGRPPLEPRIAALEAGLQAIMSELAVIHALVNPANRIHPGSADQASAYKPAFDRWPGIQR